MLNLHTWRTLLGLSVFWLVFTSGTPGQTGLPSWEVRATYHLPGGGDEAAQTVRWRFEVQAEFARDDGVWWRVQVRDADGRTPVEGTFLLHPGRGLIGSVQVREFYQSAWHDYPLQQAEPAPRYFQTFGPLPLDFVGRDGLSPDDVQYFQYPVPLELDGQTAVRREYRIRSEPAAGIPDHLRKSDGGFVPHGPYRLLRIEDSFSPGGPRWMTWEDRLPWWLEYRTPAYTARLVSWEGRTGR